jgi:hypothetical protein
LINIQTAIFLEADWLGACAYFPFHRTGCSVVIENGVAECFEAPFGEVGAIVSSESMDVPEFFDIIPPATLSASPTTG